MNAPVNLPTSAPIIRAAEEGERRWFYGGGVHLWKATAGETNGAFLLFEDRLDQGERTPLHTHPDADETMYMLDGEILLHMDGEEHRIGPGGMAMAPAARRTRSWLPRRRHACSVCILLAARRRSIGEPASRSSATGRDQASSTSPGSTNPPLVTAASRSSDHHHSIRTARSAELRRAPHVIQFRRGEASA